VRTFHKLGIRLLVNVTLYQADYFSFSITLYEETAINVNICPVSYDNLNHCNSLRGVCAGLKSVGLALAVG
jgi:hypothetical protein